MTDKPDNIIRMYRNGDFYEMYDEDAQTAHRILGIVVTRDSEGRPIAGVPYHSVEGYLRRLILAGYKPAVCEPVNKLPPA